MNNALFIFSNYYLVFKKYANNRCSDEEIINGLLGILIKKYEIKGKTDLLLYYAKAECSKLKNRKLDISENIRLYLQNDHIEKEILDETKKFLNKYINFNFKSNIINEISKLYNNDKLISKENCLRLDSYKDDFELYVSITLVEVLKYNNLKNIRKIKISEQGNSVINIYVGDILDNGFIKSIEKYSSIVIPVENSFDTKISKSNDKLPHISDKTLHGKWINKMLLSGTTEKELKETIHNSLQSFGYAIKHNLKYPIGAIASVEYKSITFYLLAISELNDRNVASASIEDINNAITSLLDFYNIYGQGYPIYIPLIGTGMSRIPLTHSESLQMIKNILKTKLNDIQGEINIVIYENDLSKIKKEDLYDI